MSRHRSVRPRYGRIVLALAAFSITLFSILGGVGLISMSSVPPPAEADTGFDIRDAAAQQVTRDVRQQLDQELGPLLEEVEEVDPEALPTNSGTGRRAVFSQAAQRVWIVNGDGSVRRTYLVSGSLVDNLDPGTYEVWSRSRWAVGVDDSGVMQYFVRFAHGQTAAIGFHSIPSKLGTPLQTRAELGTPQSHGCIRQAMPDAIAMWKFAGLGTKVVVI